MFLTDISESENLFWSGKQFAIARNKSFALLLLHKNAFPFMAQEASHVWLVHNLVASQS